MPTRAPRACGYPGCGGIQGKCPVHDAQRVAARNARIQRQTTAQKGYDASWRRLVAAAKRAQRTVHGQVFCIDCGITEDQGKATDNPLSGDHLRWPARTIDDVAIRCRRCNSRRGAKRRFVNGQWRKV